MNKAQLISTLKYFERREIRRALEPFRQLLGGQPQRRLAHGVARQRA